MEAKTPYDDELQLLAKGSIRVGTPNGERYDTLLLKQAGYRRALADMEAKYAALARAINFALQEDICPWCQQDNSGRLGCEYDDCMGVTALAAWKERDENYNSDSTLGAVGGKGLEAI